METHKAVIVDDELWRKFRKKCVLTDKKMKDVLNEFLIKYVGEAK